MGRLRRPEREGGFRTFATDANSMFANSASGHSARPGRSQSRVQMVGRQIDVASETHPKHPTLAINLYGWGEEAVVAKLWLSVEL